MDSEYQKYFEEIHEHISTFAKKQEIFSKFVEIEKNLNYTMKFYKVVQGHGSSTKDEKCIEMHKTCIGTSQKHLCSINQIILSKSDTLNYITQEEFDTKTSYLIEKLREIDESIKEASITPVRNMVSETIEQIKVISNNFHNWYNNHHI